MKVIALCFLFAVASAAPPNREPSKVAVIVRYDSDNIGVGSYGYAVETSDGQVKEERGELVDAGTKDEYISVQGKFRYIGPDNVQYEVIYLADKDGYRATGAHLPVAPQK